jgi:hypothetical protein
VVPHYWATWHFLIGQLTFKQQPSSSSISTTSAIQSTDMSLDASTPCHFHTTMSPNQSTTQSTMQSTPCQWQVNAVLPCQHPYYPVHRHINATSTVILPSQPKPQCHVIFILPCHLPASSPHHCHVTAMSPPYCHVESIRLSCGTFFTGPLGTLKVPKMRDMWQPLILTHPTPEYIF